MIMDNKRNKRLAEEQIERQAIEANALFLVRFEGLGPFLPTAASPKHQSSTQTPQRLTSTFGKKLARDVSRLTVVPSRGRTVLCPL